jgi:hypothetical protein
MTRATIKVSIPGMIPQDENLLVRRHPATDPVSKNPYLHRGCMVPAAGAAACQEI